MSAVARSLPHLQANATLTRVTTAAVAGPVDPYDDRTGRDATPTERWAGAADAWVRVRSTRRQSGQRSERSTERTVEIPAVCVVACGDALHIARPGQAVEAWVVMDVAEVPVPAGAAFLRCAIERG